MTHNQQQHFHFTALFFFVFYWFYFCDRRILFHWFYLIQNCFQSWSVWISSDSEVSNFVPSSMLLSWQQTCFVATNMCLSQQTHVCRDKTFVGAKMIQTFVGAKIILVAAPANDRALLWWPRSVVLSLVLTLACRLPTTDSPLPTPRWSCPTKLIITDTIKLPRGCTKRIFMSNLSLKLQAWWNTARGNQPAAQAATEAA